jgi:hypothetical protein
MRRAIILTAGLIFAAAALASVHQPSATSAKALAGEPTANATVLLHFPVFAMQLTHTPTATPTETQTPEPTTTGTPTSTGTTPPTDVSYPVSTGHLSGGIEWKDQENGHPKDHYYMYIEWIKFFQWIFNDSSTTMERYKVLGVNVTWPDPNRTAFHTSWTTAPDYAAPRCYGPNGNTLNWGIGLRCGADRGSAQSEDQIGGNNDVVVDTPGWYTLQYYVCQSATIEECHDDGEWHPLGASIQFRADPPPSSWHVAPSTPKGDVCRLVIIGPERGRLECAKRAKPPQPSLFPLR